MTILLFGQQTIQLNLARRGTYFPVILAICLAAASQISFVSATGIYMNAFRGTVKNGLNNGLLRSGGGMKELQKTAHELQNADKLFSKSNGIDIRKLTIPKLNYFFATKQLSSVNLTNCYIQRIHLMNPYLNAVIQINPDAIKQAYQADLERAKCQNHSTLLGIPIMLKDNYDTKDLMETTAGSPALLGVRPKHDEAAVKALRKAGAVILVNKADLSEFANFRGTNIPNGWSCRGGPTKNPYNINEDPSGSSSGSGVSVAANLAMAALGTETDGSLICPANVQGLCTIKPTLGNPSTKGVIPLSHSQDNIGPMTRTMMDLAIMLDVLMPPQETSSPNYALGCGSNHVHCLGHPFGIGVSLIHQI